MDKKKLHDLPDNRNEKWIAVPSIPNYEASTYGRVRSIDRKLGFFNRWGGVTHRTHKGKILTPRDNGNGYKKVKLDCDKEEYIHRLIALSFIGQPPTKNHQVAHLDGNRENNIPQNLVWATALENSAHRIIHGNSGKGSKNTMAVLTEDSVSDILSLYVRGKTIKELASSYQVSVATIHLIIKNQTWKHVFTKDRETAKLKFTICKNKCAPLEKIHNLYGAMRA